MHEMIEETEEDWDCPLCMEEMDMSDRNFKPCPCGYQVPSFPLVDMSLLLESHQREFEWKMSSL